MKTGQIKIFYIKRRIIFPGSTVKVELKSPGADTVMKGNTILAFPVKTILSLFMAKKRVATICEVVNTQREMNSVKIELRGLERVFIKKIYRLRTADYEEIGNKSVSSYPERLNSLKRKAQELIFLINVDESDKLISLLNYISDLGQMTDFIANYFVLDISRRYELFTLTDTEERSDTLLTVLDKLIHDINSKRTILEI